MRLVLAIMVLLALAAFGWSGWWFYHAAARERAVTEWLAERREAGWVAEAAEVRVDGFPYRFDTIVAGLELADPGSGWSWRAPEFGFTSLAYQPQHIIADWPGEQVIATPIETVRVRSDTLRGSVVFDPTSRLTLNRSSIEIGGLTILGDSGWQAAIGRALLATRQAAVAEVAPGTAHDVSFTAQGLRLPEAWTARLDRAGVLPEALETAEFDLTLVFDRPWDRAAVEGENPALEQVRIREARLGWGRLDLRGSGTLTADAQGYAEGEIDLRARNWREMVEIAESAGAIPSGMSGAVRSGLGFIAQLSGDPEVLELPLTFADGRTRLGPIGLGPAPVLAPQRQ